MSKSKKQITFILPGIIRIPMGGVKVVIEYANQLAERGHRVTLIYPDILGSSNILYKLKKSVVGVIDKINKLEKDLYYTPDQKVNVLVVKKIISRYIPDGDIVIAVGWQSANWVNKLPNIHGEKIYLLQSFETYFKNKKEVISTYHLPLKKITISNWIIDELEKINESALGPLGNSINPKEFFITKPFKERSDQILMMYHPAKIKGATDGIRVLNQLKKENQNLRAIFVAPRKPIHKIPKWIEIFVRPSVETLRELYNSSKIFLHPSHWEGWPLPPMEAIACGCAVVASNNRGISEYLTHTETCLISDIGDTNAMTINVKKLLDNPEIAFSLANKGQAVLEKYSWMKIVDNFESILKL